jgi:hypothetical protein
MDKHSILDEIFSNDPFGILNIKPVSSGTRNEEERLLASFQPILDFYEKNNREPQQASEDVQEYQLSSRLNSIRENPSKIEILKKYDTHGLFTTKKKEINAIDDIFNDDSWALIEDDTLGLFDFKHIDAPDKDRAESDFVARRKPCKDFIKYEQLLKDVQHDLKTGKRKLVDFKQGNLREGTYYIHNGVLFLLEKINISFKEHYREDGTRVREDGRTRCIFENGTESNMLKRSVEKILYANGKVVTENADDVAENLIIKANNITDRDQAFGYIYVLKSKSDRPEISSIQNLYKIGYSKVTVEERTKNAKEEPTYLMADVGVLQTYKCYNMNPQKLEQLLHKFFGEACLNIDIFDKNGIRHTPREWFIAPLSIIEEAIEMILTGDIVRYQYSFSKQQIIGSL